MQRGSAFTEEAYRDNAAFRVGLHEFLRRADEHARDRGLTSQQYLLLLTVRGHSKYPAVTIGDISTAMRLQQSSTSLLVDRCVKRDLLLRTEDPIDRRRALVQLSEEGQQMLDDIMEANRRDLGRLEATMFGSSLREAISAANNDIVA
jgi:DNA-binding MarR family transcriptional regulator